MKKNKLLLFTFLFFSFNVFAQTFSKEDKIKIKDIGISVIDLIALAPKNFEGMWWEEYDKNTTNIMYKATATPKMHAEEYYIAYIPKNKRNYYVACYKTRHSNDIGIVSIVRLADVDSKFKFVMDKVNEKDTVSGTLYFDEAKVGRMILYSKIDLLTFTVRLYDDKFTLN